MNYINEKLELLCHDEPWNEWISFALIANVDGFVHVAQPLVLEKRAEQGYLEPAFRLNRGAAQKIFNELWQLGFRPKDGTGNSGHIAALSYHLEDMRRLVFKGKK